MLGEITGETIKSAVAMKIRQNISLENQSTFKIYKEQILQGFSKPSFFIWVLDVAQQKLMLNNYERSYQINVRFHLDENTPNLYEQLSEVGNKLLLFLAKIDVPLLVNNVLQNKPVKGTQMSLNIVEGVLQFYATYTIKIKQVVEQTPEMQQLKIEDI